ncbi:MAG: DUF934 domain-containing protein [Proteobacteria bacterium]|nr:DUF934 domain-containing protein [Pseudomonadota bacterium]
MAKIIKHHDIVADQWRVLTLAANDTPASVKLPVGPLLVPLAVWQARKAELIRREWEHHELLGVWLATEDDPADIAAELDDFSVVGVHFPLAGDGRGYYIATLLRMRFGYRGELRAFGSIGRDHLHYLQRVGFDSFAVNQPELAIASLDDFSEAYQVAANQPLPLFRRRTLSA